MATGFFEVKLSVQSKEGEAELVVPDRIQPLNYQFILVKEGGEEALIRVEASKEEIKQIEMDKHCKKLTESQMNTVKKTYPAPKLKQKYRPTTSDNSEEIAATSAFVIDDQGTPVVDTWQTVRSGFYLMDIPISPPEGDSNA